MFPLLPPYIGIKTGRTHPPFNNINHQTDMRYHAANIRAEEKERKYRALMESRDNAEFIPIVFETSGSIHPQATKLLRKYAKYASEIKKIPADAIYNYFLKIISTSFQRALADTINNKIYHLSSRCNMEIIHPEFNNNDILVQMISM